MGEFLFEQIPDPAEHSLGANWKQRVNTYWAVPGCGAAFLERNEGLHAWAIQMTVNDRALASSPKHAVKKKSKIFTLQPKK
jgi:hypothetical protein